VNLSDLSPGDRQFVDAHPHAAMITVGADGCPKAVKMEAAVVDGGLQSASHADKVRTVRLRRDRRCTLYFADDEHRWLSLEADVEIVAGPDAPAQLLRYFRVRDGKPTEPLDYHSDRSHYTDLDGKAFQKVMAEEDAVLYRFMVTKAYGNR
jgi:Pyridoxamine 5'-phosphate oxidase